MLQDADGQVIEAHSASAGLDYPGIGPQLAALAEAGRIEVAAATDREAVAAMKTTTRTEGILPALETAHAIAALPRLLAGRRRGSGGSWPDEILVLLGFSGRGDKDLAALERFADVEPWAERPDDAGHAARRPSRHERHRRRPADRGRLRPGAGRRPRRAHPVRRRGLPGRRHEPPRSRSRRPTPAPTCSRSACRTRTRWPTARRSSAHRASRSPPARRSSGSLRLIERIGAARPDLPLVPMGYANQVIGGGDGEAVARRLAGAGAAGLIVADLTPDEGAPFEAVARDAGLAVVYLVAPTTPPGAPRARSPPGAAGSCTACRSSA